jgi:hypothetical protein
MWKWPRCVASTGPAKSGLVEVQCTRLVKLDAECCPFPASIYFFDAFVASSSLELATEQPRQSGQYSSAMRGCIKASLRI